MVAHSEYNMEKRTGRGAIILGGLAALYAIIAFFSNAFGGEVEIKEMEGFKALVIYLQDFLVLVSMVVALFGGIISLWNRITGSIFLILAGIIMIVLSFLPATFQTPMSQGETHAGVFGAPFLIAGVLILWIRWRSKRRDAIKSES